MVFCKAAFQLVGPQPLLVHGVINPNVPDSAFPFVELHDAPVAPFFFRQSRSQAIVLFNAVTELHCIMYGGSYKG